MPYNPVPSIIVGEYPLATERTHPDGSKAFDPVARTLVGSASIKWGRDDPFTQPEPATLTFTMFDPGRTWLNKVRDRKVISTGVIMNAQIPTNAFPSTPPLDAPNGVFCVFSGFVSRVNITRYRGWTTEGWKDGYLVTVTCADRTSQLGNVLLPWGEWGEERMIDRAIKIRDFAAPVGIRQYYFQQDYQEALVRSIQISRNGPTSALDLLGDLYTSFAHQYQYIPTRNVVNRIQPHQPLNASVRTIIVRGTRRIELKADNRTDYTGQETDLDKASYQGGSMPACEVSSTFDLDSDQRSNIARIECRWIIKANNYQNWLTHEDDTSVPPPRPVLSYESWFVDGKQIDPILWSVYYRATNATAGPHHPRTVYDTRYTGGFMDGGAAMAALSTYESPAATAIGGSPWFEAIGRIPAAVAAGGTVTYSDGNWRVETDYLSIALDSNSGMVQSTWAQHPTNRVWGQDTDTGYYYGSVSWYDLAWTTS